MVCRDNLLIDHMWWQKYFHPEVLECFQGVEQFAEEVLLSLHLSQAPPFPECPARNGFYQHRKKDMTMHNLELLHTSMKKSIKYTINLYERSLAVVTTQHSILSSCCSAKFISHIRKNLHESIHVISKWSPEDWVFMFSLLVLQTCTVDMLLWRQWMIN